MVFPIGSEGLGEPLHMLQHAPVNRMDDPVRPELPIRRRRDVQLVPGAPLEARAVAGERDEAELAAAGPEVAVEVRGVEVAVGASLRERRRLRGHVEAQPMRLLQTVMGSTKVPVENSQRRIAPTPLPSIRARRG